MSRTLNVSEVFYSLQGEGGRAGEPSVFVRLQGCSAKHACLQSGIVCDTEYESGARLTLEELSDAMRDAVCRATGLPSVSVTPWVVWTGGEPLDQLTGEHVAGLQALGWQMHALETSGTKRIEDELAYRLDWITVSPKVAEHVLQKHFGHLKIERDIPGAPVNVHELRYVRHAGQPGIPQPVLHAHRQFLSPHSDGLEINADNVRHCAKLCLQHPNWRMSVQQHKIWRVL